MNPPGLALTKPRSTRLLRGVSRAAAAAGLAALALAAPAKDALACGACFIQQGDSTVVNGHRMVLSVSQAQTVLWDQIQYQGDPAEFAWVLPVKPGARIEVASAAFFEVLEATTQRQIKSPPVSCGGGGSGCSSGLLAASAEAGDDFGPEENPVTVVHSGTVGPYETVTLETSQPGALNTWLSDHGYNVDPASQPIIDAYVGEGFDFIALRLQPGKGITQMAPVRVVSEGASPTLPLRMVGIGTGATVPIVLYVIGEGRWTVQNFPEANVQTQLLAWDFKTQQSNYAELRKSALAANDGRSWLTAYAQQGALFADLGYAPDGYSQVDFPATYFQQAQKDGDLNAFCGLGLTAHAPGVVVNPCPDGEPWDSPNCGTVPDGDVDVRDLGCPGADDLATALVGMHTGDVWVTRLEADLPHAALADDLVLAASAAQEPVQKDLVANIAENVDGVCGGGPVVNLDLDRKPPQNLVPAFMSAVLGAMALALVARRMQPARRPR
jgi:hypothetical protein